MFASVIRPLPNFGWGLGTRQATSYQAWHYSYKVLALRQRVTFDPFLCTLQSLTSVTPFTPSLTPPAHRRATQHQDFLCPRSSSWHHGSNTSQTF